MGVNAVIAPDIWEPHLNHVLGGSPDGTAARILRYMHARHVGISVELARDLAIWLDQTRLDAAPDANNAWNGLVSRLQDTLGASRRRQRARRMGLSLSRFPSYAISRVALPLAHRAILGLGTNILYGGEGHIVQADLSRYHDRLSRCLQDLYSSPELELFFEEHARFLSGLVRRGMLGESESSLPTADEVALPLLLRLEPTRESETSRSRRFPRVFRSASRRQGRKPPQGAVIGFTMSTNPEDIGQMIHSEHLMPDLIKLDRILNTGFYIRHRPPYRRHKRDVLVVGALPEHPDAHLPAKLGQAIWFEAVCRFSSVLAGNAMLQTDFLWLEGRSRGYLKCQTARLSDFPGAFAGRSLDARQAFRHQFVEHLAWLPGFADRGQRWQRLFDGEGNPRSAAEERLAEWCFRAFNQGIQKLQRPDQEPVEVDDYRVVHMMFLLPEATSDRAADSFPAPEQLDRFVRLLASMLTLPPNDRHRYDVVSLPGVLPEDLAWRVRSADAVMRETKLFCPEVLGFPASLNRASGVLADYWEERLIEGVFDD